MASAGAPSPSSTGANMNPRKFAEKIALHTQKGAEETAEFQKIMSECAAVKGHATVPRPMVSTTPQMMVGGNGGGHSGRHHLNPNNFASAVPRHGSLPNVNAGVTAQMSVMRSGGMGDVMGTTDPSVLSALGISPSGGGVSASSATSGGVLSNSGGHISVRDSMQQQQHQQQQHQHMGQPLHAASMGIGSASAGPIRHKHRKDTSPYSSDRCGGSNSGAGGAANSHLSPPDTWRRVRSDSSLHQSVLTGTASSGGHDQASHHSSNGGSSPRHAVSPTVQRRGPCIPNVTSPSHVVTNVQNVNQLPSYLGLPIPKDAGGVDTKPGSLPDLTNFHVHSNVGNHSPSSNVSSVGGCGPQLDPDDQGSPYSSSMSATSVGSSSFVRLSDNEISKILSIPMSLVSDSQQQQQQPMEQQTKNANTKTPFCDNSNRNLLHMNKGMAIDPQQQQNYMYQQQNSHVGMSPGQNTNSQGQQQKVLTSFNGEEDPFSYSQSKFQGEQLQSMSKYRNPQSNLPPQSPVGHMQGSPLGRSTSPIDMVGSPHSPVNGGGGGSLGTNSNSPMYPDVLAMAPHHQQQHQQHQQQQQQQHQQQQQLQQQMDLSKEFQRVSMLENSPGSEHGMYFQQASGFQQPMNNDFAGFFNNQQQQDTKCGVGQFNQVSSPNPQTPSSIPEIILTDDAGTDQALQRMLNMPFDASDCLSADELKEGLGKLDDSMIRLLDDNGCMDQQIADPATEEHLKM